MKRNAVIELRAFANGSDVIEETVFENGAVLQRKVGNVQPRSYFELIGRRLDAIAADEERRVERARRTA